MQNEGILTYHPKKDKPQLLFTKDRVNADDLALDMKLYKFLKKRHQTRLEKAFDYCEKPKCRSVQLLSYFGEEGSDLCGVCDVCLGRTEGGLSKDDYKRYSGKIIGLLKKENLTVEEILDSFSPKHQERILKAVQLLIEEKIIENIKEEEKGGNLGIYKLSGK